MRLVLYFSMSSFGKELVSTKYRNRIYRITAYEGTVRCNRYFLVDTDLKMFLYLASEESRCIKCPQSPYGVHLAFFYGW